MAAVSEPVLELLRAGVTQQTERKCCRGKVAEESKWLKEVTAGGEL